jgi:hypothetical protein
VLDPAAYSTALPSHPDPGEVFVGEKQMAEAQQTWQSSRSAEFGAKAVGSVVQRREFLGEVSPRRVSSLVGGRGWEVLGRDRPGSWLGLWPRSLMDRPRRLYEISGEQLHV